MGKATMVPAQNNHKPVPGECNMIRFTQSVLCSLLLMSGMVFADGTVTLTLSSPSNGQTVNPFDPITWTLTAEVSTGDNEGLALISADLVQDSLNPELFDLPQADTPPAEMLGFARPGGVTNPAGYEGTQVGSPGSMDLAQIGGGQNVFGQIGPPAVGQDVDVESGIGQDPGGQVIATGTFSAPSTEGTYTFSIVNAVANTLESVETPPIPSPVAQATVVTAVGSFSFTLGVHCCPCLGDLSPGHPNCDDVVNVTDFTVFAASYGAQQGDPEYNSCTDLAPAGNPDGVVNVTDFTVFAAQFGQPCP
jgi:hypothetical protein